VMQTAGDSNSENALSRYRRDCVHLLSTSAYAESCAVLARLRREDVITGDQFAEALHSLTCVPWRQLATTPGRGETTEAAIRWNLRGADLWHFATALTLRRRQLPELLILTYDTRLGAAAEDAGFAAL
jgi:hypothetical protein